MARSFDTVVLADPSSCREAARWLDKMHQGVSGIGTALHKARSNSESVWEGEASDNFRELLRGNAGDADQTSEFLNRTKIALESFADEIATVTTDIDQARLVARSGGLVVTPTTVEEPDAPPVKLPSAAPGARLNEKDYTPEEQRMLDDYGAKVDVWNEVVNTILDARRREERAHSALAGDLHMMKDFTSYLTPRGWAWGPILTGVYSGPYMTAAALSAAAATNQARANGALDVLADPSLPPEDRKKVLTNQVVWAGKVETARKAARGVRELDTRIPGGGRIKGMVGWSPRGIGAAGVIVTAYQTYESIQKGSDPGKEITKGVATTGGSAAIGTGMFALAAAGYISGTVATGGTLLLGTAVCAGISYAVDHYYYE